ncbi:MAG: pyridoxal phosphate-dependent aminotransferase [Eubacteriales bacterium]|jgi:aspartate aminotransferase|nr:pyridoxal phosphate-dependent aminotransferase [Eubacteriales bacterium]
MKLSEKFMSISPSPTLSIDAKFKDMIANGIDVVGFGAGEPDFDTPSHIKQAAIKAIQDGFTKYTPAAGTVALKKAICEKFLKDNNLSYSPSDIVVSNGAKHSLVNVFQAILNAGDEVIIPAPFWVSYPEMVKIADGVPVFIETTEENSFKFTPQQLKDAITPKTKALILNSPSNPTGMVYTKDELKEIAKIAVENNIFVVSDEIYEELIYEGEHTSIAQLGEDIKARTIIVNGVSKSYSMTGWRIGYTASSPQIAKIMANVQSHATSNPCSISQAAAVAALQGTKDSIEVMKKAFIERRNYMVDRINSIPNLSCLKPNGAFYVMMNIKDILGKEIGGKIVSTSDEFCELALEKCKVALVPGSGFGAEGYVRWSYATSMENIKKGLDRIEAFLA